MNDTQMVHTARPSGGYQFAPAINHTPVASSTHTHYTPRHSDGYQFTQSISPTPIANSTHTHYMPRHSDGYQFTQSISPTPVTNGNSTLNQPWPCENVHFSPFNHRTVLPHAPATLPSRVPVHHFDPHSMPTPQQQHVPPFKRRCQRMSPFHGPQPSRVPVHHSDPQSMPTPQQQHVPPFKRRCQRPSPFHGPQPSTPEHQYTSASSNPSPHQPIARPQPQSPPNQQFLHTPRTSSAPPVPTTTILQQPQDTRGTPSPFSPPDAAPAGETPNYANWRPIPLLHAFNEVFGIPAMPPGHPMVQELLGAPSPLPPNLKMGHELRVLALEGWWDKTEAMVKAEPWLVGEGAWW
ncbi:MAG: hypothetical protein L6R35_000943 [Caloplaca aegaea]|nr:MAG: hypothetical protein L6R35_000943 [Caloplaca aegaea]